MTCGLFAPRDRTSLSSMLHFRACCTSGHAVVHGMLQSKACSNPWVMSHRSVGETRVTSLRFQVELYFSDNSGADSAWADSSAPARASRANSRGFFDSFSVPGDPTAINRPLAFTFIWGCYHSAPSGSIASKVKRSPRSTVARSGNKTP